MNDKERVEALHRKMKERRKIKERRVTMALCAVSNILVLCLILVISQGELHQGAVAGSYSGAIMLYGNAGSYVLTALLAFALGVVITIILKKMKEAKSGSTDE